MINAQTPHADLPSQKHRKALARTHFEPAKAASLRQTNLQKAATSEVLIIEHSGAATESALQSLLNTTTPQSELPKQGLDSKKVHPVSTVDTDVFFKTAFGLMKEPASSVQANNHPVRQPLVPSCSEVQNKESNHPYRANEIFKMTKVLSTEQFVPKQQPASQPLDAERLPLSVTERKISFFCSGVATYSILRSL